ncbi:MAG: DoxX family membrane protein [Gammaproteobacteria bacterium]
MNILKNFNNWSMANILARWTLGIVFLMAGFWKVFEFTAIEHARQYFVEAYAETWIPAWLLWVLGLAIPYLEFLAGMLLIAGLRVRNTVSVLGVLLLITTYGHLLKQPLFDIDGHTFTRLALVLFLLIAPNRNDILSVDYWIGRKVKSEK